MSPPDPPRVEALLEHFDWTRRLARGLVGEPDRADDLTQETWLSVLRSPPPLGRPLRPWITRVMRNVARKGARSERTRADHEGRAAGGAAVPSDADLAGSVDLHRKLVEQVMELDPLYRRPILLRFFEGLAAADIAEREGVPLATVRTRLRRGMQQLRERLERRDRGDWRSALLPLLPTGGKVASTGVVVMGSKSVLTSVSLLAAVVLGLVWWQGGLEPAIAPGAGAEPADSVSQGALAGGALTPPGTGDDAGTADSVEVDERRPGTSSVVAGHPADDLLTGVVIGPLGAPLAAATVLVRQRPTSGRSSLDLPDSAQTIPIGNARCNEEGLFEAIVPAHIPLEVIVKAPGYAQARKTNAYGGEHLVVQLGFGSVLEGRVVDEETGLGLAGIPLRGWMMKPRMKDLIKGTTDPSGSFRFDDLPPGQLTLAVEPNDWADPGWEHIVLEAGGLVRHEFALKSGVTISGVVTDGESGRPVQGAEVGAGWTFRRPVRTDAEGRYALVGFGGPGVYSVHARAQGFGKRQHEFASDAMPQEDVSLDFTLPPARSAIGRVVGPDSTPVQGAYVAAVASEMQGQAQRTDWDATRTDAQGRFRLSSLTPDLRHKVIVRAGGLGRVVFDLPPDEASHAEFDLGTIKLERGGRLVGVVLDEQGEPRPGLPVAVTGHATVAGRYLPEGGAPRDLWYTDFVKSSTDGRGRFHFAELAGGTYEVSVREPGLTAKPSITVKIAADELRDDLVLVAPLGLSIQGVVVDSFGVPCARVDVRAYPPGGGGRELARFDTTSAGVFTLTGLTPGPYQIHADPHSFNRDEDEERELFKSVVRGIEAGSRDLRITLRSIAPVTGVVQNQAGDPGGDLVVRATDAVTGRWLAYGRTDGDGAFRLSVPAGSVMDLETRSIEPAPQGQGYTTLPADQGSARLANVTAGTSDLVLVLPE